MSEDEISVSIYEHLGMVESYDLEIADLTAEIESIRKCLEVSQKLNNAVNEKLKQTVNERDEWKQKWYNTNGQLAQSSVQIADLIEERDALKAELAEMRKTSPSGKMALSIGRLKDENARLRSALQFYADKKNWCMHGYETVLIPHDGKNGVGGERARAALAAGRTEGE